MSTQNSIIESILKTSLRIQEDYPELVKYMDEMPEHYHTNPSLGVNDKDLKEYLDSLIHILKTHTNEY